MTDNSTVSSDSTVSLATIASQQTNNLNPNGHRNRVEREIHVCEDFGSWKTDGKTRYILPHLLCKNRVEEKMTIETHGSDAVVWNILNITSNLTFPTSSPTLQQKAEALNWLVRFKKYLNKVIGREVRNKYFVLANQDNYSDIRVDGEKFTSFEDLVKKTKYLVGKEVRIR